MAGNPRQYHHIADEYIRRFCDKHEVEFGGWIGEPGHIAIIDNKSMQFRDIVFDLDTRKEKTFYKNWKTFGGFQEYFEFCTENGQRKYI